MTLTRWTDGVHHDGSEVYVSNPLPKLGETVTIRLRTPAGAPLTRVFLRSEPDGEGHLEPMTRIDDASTATADCWEASLTVIQPTMAYRFKILTADGAYYYNQLGVARHEMPDYYDFKLLANYAAPAWVKQAVFYQIFPDRFANGDPSLTPKPGEWSDMGFSVTVKEWGDDPVPWKEGGALDFFGGDIPGIIEKLDYLQDLGVNALFLNPIFDSASNHRYNITNYFHIDPHLGGDDALIALREALDARGMYLILDITPNHCGSLHPWFTAAQQDPAAPTADFFYFKRRPNDYEMWMGVPTLPKLNYRSDALRSIMYKGDNAVFRYWLREPFRIDGWRMDVANMTARHGDIQLGHKVWRGIRRAVKAERADAYLMGENFFDGTPMLQGDELDATMNYQGFNLPTWRFLGGVDSTWQPGSQDDQPTDAATYAGQLNAYRAAIPWAVAAQQFNQLCTHDTVRILTILKGNKALMKLGATLTMTYPGVPCIYYGDEIGMEGGPDPDNRRTMIWDEARWDSDMRAHYQRLIALRRSAHALMHGGYQLLHAQGDVLAFARASHQQTLIVVAHRSSEARADVTVSVAAAALPDGQTLVDVVTGATYTVREGALTFPMLDAVAGVILEVR